MIIDDRGQPRLIDFGLACRSDLDSDLTRDGAIQYPGLHEPGSAEAARSMSGRTFIWA